MAGRPGQIPAQLVGHTLFYFSEVGDLVFDPMAGGGVVPDMCLAFGKTSLISGSPLKRKR